jgi:hypothetical protein
MAWKRLRNPRQKEAQGNPGPGSRLSGICGMTPKCGRGNFVKNIFSVQGLGTYGALKKSSYKILSVREKWVAEETREDRKFEWHI